MLARAARVARALSLQAAGTDRAHKLNKEANAHKR